ncbi:MAG: hypothetical protein P8172_01290 [Gammaproteobacteria bacterium]|jgi:predicted flap endonuclease-1-like 5' DNA nuclease
MSGNIAVFIGLGLLAALLGGAIGWLAHFGRCRRQRLGLAAYWQEKLEVEELARARLEKQVGKLTTRVDAARRAERDALRRLARTEEEMTEAARGADHAGAELTDCHMALASTNRKRDELHQQLQKLLEHSRELMATSKAKDEKIFALSRELESWKERVPPLVQRYRDKAMEASEALQALETQTERTHQLEEALRTRMAPSSDAPTDNGRIAEARRVSGRGRDDLKRIRGIGPVLERLLNDMGIDRLQQIADFGPEEIREVEAALKDFPGRIERDRWVEQARGLIREGRRDAGTATWLGRTET